MNKLKIAILKKLGNIGARTIVKVVRIATYNVRQFSKVPTFPFHSREPALNTNSSIVTSVC